MDFRTNKINLIVGTRGTGKTDFVKNLIIHQQSNFGKQLVLDTFDSLIWRNLKTWNQPTFESYVVPILPIARIRSWQSGIYRTFSSDVDEIFPEIDKHLFDCHLVMEDATKYIGKTLTKPMKRFLIDTKQKNIDLTLIFHSLAAVPPDLVRNSDSLTLFKTNEGKVSQSKYPWPQIPEIMRRVRMSENRYAYITIQLN